MGRAKPKTTKCNRPKKPRKKLKISCEILPPGTLKRNPSSFAQTPEERWDDILGVCGEVVAGCGVVELAPKENKKNC